MFHFHWFKEHHKSGNHIYSECRCGKRRVLKLYYVEVWAPIDKYWLEQKERPTLIPPNRGSGGLKPSLD